MQEKTFMAQEY